MNSRKCKVIAFTTAVTIGTGVAAFWLLETTPVAPIDFFGEYLIKTYARRYADEDMRLRNAPEVSLSFTGWRIDSLIEVHGADTLDTQNELVAILKSIAFEKRWRLRSRTTAARVEFVDSEGEVSRTVRFTAPTPGW